MKVDEYFEVRVALTSRGTVVVEPHGVLPKAPWVASEHETIEGAMAQAAEHLCDEYQRAHGSKR